MVAEPVARTLVHLDIAGPQHAVYFDFCVEKVWAGVDKVVHAGVYHIYCLPVGGDKRRKAVQAMLPNVMEQVFHELFHIG